MPSYHFSAQIVGRSPYRAKVGGNPRSVVAMAAYRSGSRLVDGASGRVADFSRRRGVVHAEVMAPEGTAPWLRDRERLWNHVEAMEKRRDAQLAREIDMALPHELPAAERLALVRSFVAEHFVARGMVADIAIHEPVAEKGDDPRNHHAHVMLTLRQATPDGLRAVKTREWNSDSLLLAWRRAWSAAQNRALERAGLRVRVDHRSLATQRDEAARHGQRVKAMLLDRAPEIHIGPRARQAHKRGRVPASRIRETTTARPREGRFVAGKSSVRRRQVDYARIDRGTSRTEYVARLASRERDRLRRLTERMELRHSRIQARLVRARRADARLREMRARRVRLELERFLSALLAPRLRASARHRDLLALFRGWQQGRGLGRGRFFDLSPV